MESPGGSTEQLLTLLALAGQMCDPELLMLHHAQRLQLLLAKRTFVSILYVAYCQVKLAGYLLP